MIAVFSTSSPIASCAVFDEAGLCLVQGSRDAPRAGSQALTEMLNEQLGELKAELSDLRLFVADVGPGSFTGCRTATTLAKSLAYGLGVSCSGVTAFDLIDATRTVGIPVRKGLVAVRTPGNEPQVVPTEQAEELLGEHAIGGIPQAGSAGPLISSLEPVEPHLLLPAYLIEPNITKTKRPIIMGGDQSG